jgi:putative transcriptional regulator
MERETRRLYYSMLATLYKNADAVEVLDYPEKVERQSINVAARLKDGRLVLFKITSDVEKLSQLEINELRSLAALLDVSAVIVAEKRGRKKLISGVIYEKKKVPVITPEDLEKVLTKGKRAGIYVYQCKDSFKVRINAEVLRERREEKGLSLGDLASSLNVSRKLIYEYERGESDPTLDKAEKLVEILGEDIIEPLDPFEQLKGEDLKPKLDFDCEIERRLARILDDLNYRLAHAKRTATDIVASGGEKLLFLVRHRRESISRTLKKADNLIRLSKMVDAEPIAIVNKEDIKRELEPEEVKVYKPEELNLLIRELNEIKRISDYRETRSR